LTKSRHPVAENWRNDAAKRGELVDRLSECDMETLVRSVQTQLVILAEKIIDADLKALAPSVVPDDEHS
jgi:hypothetical protein